MDAGVGKQFPHPGKPRREVVCHIAEMPIHENIDMIKSHVVVSNTRRTCTMSNPFPPWRADTPYNQLPPLPPEHDLESKAVLKACITARAALAELKQAAQLIPNQTMLINTIPLLEAKDSSEIENIVTTTDQLFQHVQGDGTADHATKEALRYRSALQRGFLSLKDRPL